MIINDSNYAQVLGNGRTVSAGGAMRLLSLTPSPHGRGKQPGAIRFRDSAIDGGYGAGVPMPASARIELGKYLDSIEGQIEDHIDFDPWDQNGLPYCWCNAGTQAASTKRRMMGLPHIPFSAASVGCIAADYRIRGGYGGETLKVLKELGAVDAKLWPNNAVKSSLDTPESQENRKHHKIIEFVECENDDEMLTALVLGYPTSNDYDWWSHVVMGCRYVSEDEIGIRNSWNGWGSKNKHGQLGFGRLQGRKKSPSYCFAIYQVTGSEI